MEDNETKLTKKASARVIYISPEIASRMLSEDEKIRKISGKKNRHLNRNHVEYLSREMEKDLWMFTGQAIQFDTDGQLIDGRHRLNAVLKSGKTVPMMIVTGLDPEAFSVMDLQRRRTLTQILRMEGQPYDGFVAGVAMKVLNWRDGAALVHNDARISVREALEFVRSCPEIVDSVRVVMGNHRPSPGLHPTLLSALHFLFSEKAPVDASVFIEKLLTGRDCISDLDLMIFRLREFMLRDALGTKHLPQDRMADVIIYVWNAWRQKKVKRALTNCPAAKEIL